MAARVLLLSVLITEVVKPACAAGLCLVPHVCLPHRRRSRDEIGRCRAFLEFRATMLLVITAHMGPDIVDVPENSLYILDDDA